MSVICMPPGVCGPDHPEEDLQPPRPEHGRSTGAGGAGHRWGPRAGVRLLAPLGQTGGGGGLAEAVAPAGAQGAALLTEHSGELFLPPPPQCVCWGVFWEWV